MCPGHDPCVKQTSISDAESECFPERGHPVGVCDPQHRVIWRQGKRVAAKICQVDEALRLDGILFHPLEGRHEVGSSAALGRQFDRLTWAELFHGLHGCIAVDDANRLRLRLVGEETKRRLGGAQR